MVFCTDAKVSVHLHLVKHLNTTLHIYLVVDGKEINDNIEFAHCLKKLPEKNTKNLKWGADYVQYNLFTILLYLFYVQK